MRRSLLAAVLLLLAISASAEDFYVPLSWKTEVRLVNRASTRAQVAIGLLGRDETRELSLEPGETLLWSEESAHLGVLRVTAGSALGVTAVSHCASCGSSISVPVLRARDAAAEAAVAMRTRSAPWRGGVLVVNPEEGVAVVTVTISRNGELVDQSLVRVHGRGMRLVRAEEGDSVRFDSSRPLLLLGYDNNEQTGARVFTPVPNAVGGKRRSVRSGSPLPPPPDPQTIVLTPSKDNTLYESNGTISNGAGVHIFAGATVSRGLRRALLAFDVASQIPPGSRITRASLMLHVSQAITSNSPMTLHRVAADWGEGASNAGSSQDGGGAQARTGDATWRHRFFQDQFWTTAGGDFAVAADAAAVVDETGTWTSDTMVARVQGWLDLPATNFGWLVRGDETGGATAFRFDSREIGSAATRPALTIEFIP